MDWLSPTFPISGVTTWLWLPPLVAFIISFFTSMVGVSGAFLLLPFQMSMLLLGVLLLLLAGNYTFAFFS